MAERSVTVVHTTVLRWVQCFVPVFEKKWKYYACPVGSSWRVDETYIKVKGQWRYRYRAVDNQGQTVDFLLSKNRDKAAAVRFFKKAIGSHEAPEKITLDGSRASHQAVAELKAEGVLPAHTLVRTNKYLNNLIERDHRKVKQRYYPMLGFKIRECARNVEWNRVGKQNQKRTVRHIGDHRSSGHNPTSMGSSSYRVMRS